MLSQMFSTKTWESITVTLHYKPSEIRVTVTMDTTISMSRVAAPSHDSQQRLMSR